MIRETVETRSARAAARRRAQ